MHNFKTNGNFSKYLSLTNLFRLKISYNDSLSAILKKLQEFSQSMAQIVYTDSIRAKNQTRILKN